jgi:hypothetical protein
MDCYAKIDVYDGDGLIAAPGQFNRYESSRLYHLSCSPSALTA